jgi:voltage-gated potassium channel
LGDISSPMILNIFIGLVVIGITIIIQGFGSKFWIHHLMNNYTNKPLIGFDRRTVRLLVYTALFLLTLNFIEAIIWGFTYYLLPGITEFETLEKAIYFSLVTFTTLGYGEITISSSSRILSGFEAMNGVLLLGWTTAMMFSVLQFVMKETLKVKKKK